MTRSDIRSTFIMLILAAGLVSAGCESQFQSTGEDISLQAKHAVEVLPVNPMFVAMANVEDLADSEWFDMMGIDFEGEEYAEVRQLMEETGFDPMEDIREVYFAVEQSEAGKPAGVSVAAYAANDPARMKAYIEERIADEVILSTYRGVDVFMIDAGRDTPGFSFVNEDMILMASKGYLLEGMIDRLIDEGGALNTNTALMNRIARASIGKSGWMIADKPMEEINARPSTGLEENLVQMWSAMDHMIVALNVEDNEVDSQVFLYPNESISAGDLASLTKGVRSALRAQVQEEEEAMKRLDEIKISSTRDHVRVQFAVDREFVETIRG